MEVDLSVPLSASQLRFAESAIRREKLFAVLSALGVLIGLLLAAVYAWRRWQSPDSPIAMQFVVVVLILLNARQNLRQVRYARLLRELLQGTKG